MDFLLLLLLFDDFDDVGVLTLGSLYSKSFEFDYKLIYLCGTIVLYRLKFLIDVDGT